MRILAIVALLCGVGAALGAPSTATPTTMKARAGTTVLLSSAGADNPGIAVESTGTGHIAYYATDGAGEKTLKYCRVPRGAAGCDVRANRGICPKPRCSAHRSWP